MGWLLSERDGPPRYKETHLRNHSVQGKSKWDSKQYNKRTQRTHERDTIRVFKERRKEGYDGGLPKIRLLTASTPSVVLGKGAAGWRGDLHVRLQEQKRT